MRRGSQNHPRLVVPTGVANPAKIGTLLEPTLVDFLCEMSNQLQVYSNKL